MKETPIRLFRGSVFDFIANPLETEACYRYYPDGALAVQDGYVLAVGEYETMRRQYPASSLTDYSGNLIMPGFIDTHIHFPQMEMIGAYGKQLLNWLNDYTFPLEKEFGDKEYARRMARVFIRQLFRHGTTSCMAYATVFKHSADALFEAASEYGMRMFAGKVWMNRNAPEELTDTVQSAEEDCRELIGRWHGKGRNSYVITPRFAISCGRNQLERAAALHREFPDTYIQTHLSENKDEIALALSLFPGCKDYLEVYEQAGLVTGRTVFAHGIHLSDSEMERIGNSGAVIAHCPTSNLFLGSGLFRMREADSRQLFTTIATDVGAGTSFSLLRTLGEAYKVQQLNGYPMTALEAFYKITLGAAQALRVSDKTGNFALGQEADFVVLDYRQPYLQHLRAEYMERAGKWNIENLLFGLQTFGDDRNIVATYVMGKPVYLQNEI